MRFQLFNVRNSSFAVQVFIHCHIGIIGHGIGNNRFCFAEEAVVHPGNDLCANQGDWGIVNPEKTFGCLIENLLQFRRDFRRFRAVPATEKGSFRKSGTGKKPEQKRTGKEHCKHSFHHMSPHNLFIMIPSL